MSSPSALKSAVTISLVPQARGGPFIFWDDLEVACRTAADLGFDAVEIFPPSAEALAQLPVSAWLESSGLKVAAVGTGAGWLIHKWHLSHPDAEIRRKAREFIGSIIDLAGQWGAPAIIGSLQGRADGAVTRDQALEWLREGLNELGARAERQGQPLLYEPLNRYETNLLNRAEDAVAFLKTLKTSRVKILADLFHMNIEERSPAEGIRICGEQLGHVHFVDSNRRPAGCGHIDFAPVMQALRAINYAGYLSAEALPFPDSQSAAEQTLRAFKKFAAS
jgi:sugar phosphate isomerase/epimerase